MNWKLRPAIATVIAVLNFMEGWVLSKAYPGDGNMACNLSIMARDKKIMVPLHQVLVYPVANNDMNSESYQKYAMAKPLSKPLINGWSRTISVTLLKLLI